MKNCPNCNAEIKKSLLKTVTLSSQRQVDIINMFESDPKEAYCSICGPEKLENAKQELENKIAELNRFIQKNIKEIPVISTHTPYNWKYKVLEMVTGQSTTGTGVITEFTSSFTDFFGASSTRHNKKLKIGEDNCFNQLRVKTIQLGGNAVISTDIDYSEIGSGKGILMVCMAGTSVLLENDDILGEEKKEIINKLKKANQEIIKLKKLSK